MAETRDDEHLGRSSGRLKDVYSRCGIQFGTRRRLSKPITIDSARACPRCGGHAICRWGSDRRGRPRWCCRGCARTFCASTGTVIAGLRAPDAFGCVLKDMLGDVPSSCRKLAAELQVDKTTVWEWRRKIVQGLLTERRRASVRSRDLAATDSRIAQGITGVGAACARSGSVLGARSAEVDRRGSVTAETSTAPCRLPATPSCKRRSIGQPSADHPVQANGAQTHRERAVRCLQHACCSSGSWPLGCLGEGRALLAPCSLRSRLQNQEVSPWRRELPAGALGQ